MNRNGFLQKPDFHEEGTTGMNNRIRFRRLLTVWLWSQTFAAFAVIPAASDTSAVNTPIDTRINFGIRSNAPGTKIDTLTACGTMVIVR